MSIPKYIAEPFKGRVLIICGSPLQVLIAERIITLHPEVCFDAILVSASLKGRSKKYDYYLSRLKSRCRKVIYIHREEGLSRFQIYWETLKRLVLGVTLPRYETIFLGPLAEDVEPLLLKQSRAQIITLDEGAANLTRKSYDGLIRRNRGKLSSLMTAIGGRTLEQYREKADIHISIYKERNSSPLAQYIELREFYDTPSVLLSTEIAQVEKIMLGQPLYDLVASIEDHLEYNRERTQHIVDTFKIKKYLPHPREKYRIERVEYIDTPMVFEDYIITEMEKNPTTRYEVYSFCSSGMLNVPQSAQLKFIAIDPSDKPDSVTEIYPLMGSMGIEIIKID